MVERPPRIREDPVRFRTWAPSLAHSPGACRAPALVPRDMKKWREGLARTAGKPNTERPRGTTPPRRDAYGLSSRRRVARVGRLCRLFRRSSSAEEEAPRPRSSTGRAPALYPGGSGSTPDAGSALRAAPARVRATRWRRRRSTIAGHIRDTRSTPGAAARAQSIFFTRPKMPYTQSRTCRFESDSPHRVLVTQAR